MNRLSNAIKQRDAAREEALLAAEKLNKLQEDLDNGVLQGPQQPLGSASPSQSLSTPPPFPGGTEPGEYTACDLSASQCFSLLILPLDFSLQELCALHEG